MKELNIKEIFEVFSMLGESEDINTANITYRTDKLTATLFVAKKKTV